MERKIKHAFIRIKGWNMMWEKNKSTTPSLAATIYNYMRDSNA